MLTVVCVFVEANVPFTPDYVTKLRSMVSRNLSAKHQFVCFTDRPRLLPDVHCVEIPKPQGIPGWWSKLEIFNLRHGLRGPTLYLDLDVLVMRELDPIVRPNNPAALFVPHDGDFNGRNGLSVVKKYNSSVMYFRDVQDFSELYDRWTPEVAKRLWGDQDWIGEQCPSEVVLPLRWFPRISQCTRSSLGDARVVLCKKPKNHDAARVMPWVKEVWQ